MPVLMRSTRFAPLFVTQFLGAFNDNVFKNALVMLIAYKIAAHDRVLAGLLVNVAFALFILPTLLCSYLAGQLADKFDRARVAQWVKVGEIGLAVLGALGLYTNNFSVLLLTLTGFGVDAAFFGPVKYALLPQLLRPHELVAGNGYIDAGTFLAILVGTIVAGMLILTPHGVVWVSLLMVGVAGVGWWASTQIPAAPAPAPDLQLAWNPWRETVAMLRHSSGRREEFLCILGISWFWFVGAMFLAQFPPLAKDVLHANEQVVTLFLVVFSVGIAIGSVLSSRLLKGRVSATPVPLAALGMSLFAIDIYDATRSVVAITDSTLIGAVRFMQAVNGQHIVFDLFGLALCGGMYIVPLYTLLQLRADHRYVARAIASNNLMNALFMVAASLLAMLLIRLGTSIPQLFLLTGLMTVAVALYISRLLPFSMLAVLLKLLYRVDVQGLEHWEQAGPRVLIVANHTSYLDAAIFAAFLPERVSFVVNTFIAKRWWLRPLLKLVDTYTMDPTKPMAAKGLINHLKLDKKVMIFPEGRLTMTGALMKVYEGPGMIADKSQAIVLPVRIDGAQYSPMSMLKGKMKRRWFPKITLTFLPPQRFDLPDDIKGRRRRQRAGLQLYDMMSTMMFASSPLDQTLMQALMQARRTYGGGHVVMEDQRREPLNYAASIAASAVLGRQLGKNIAADERYIGIMLPNTTTAALTFFAFQALGRAVALLNFTAGASQLLSACHAAQLKTLVTSRQFIELGKLTELIAVLTADGLRIVYLEDIRAQIGWSAKLYGLLARIWPERMVSTTPRPNDPAVVLFTSGSEGTPKGVVLSHRNILSNRYQLASRVDFGPQDIVFNCLPMFHAFGLTGATLLPLLSGVKVFFYPSPLHYRIVPELVYDSNATILFGTDTFLAGYARHANPYDFYATRYVFAGAEKLKDETRQLWMDKFGIRIFEGYGATETAPIIAVNTAMHYRAGTVGRIIPGVDVRLDAVPGIHVGQQLCIRGPNVMLGYLKDHAPGVLQPVAESWYDTGDIVTLDDEGFVTICGRTKRFAKIGGEMISLTAVEAAVNALWPRHQQVVVSAPDTRKGEMLVVLTELPSATVDVLLQYCRQHGMSELSIPKRILIVDRVPLLGSGKIDYVQAKALALQWLGACRT